MTPHPDPAPPAGGSHSARRLAKRQRAYAQYVGADGTTRPGGRWLDPLKSLPLLAVFTVGIALLSDHVGLSGRGSSERLKQDGIGMLAFMAVAFSAALPVVLYERDEPDGGFPDRMLPGFLFVWWSGMWLVMVMLLLLAPFILVPRGDPGSFGQIGWEATWALIALLTAAGGASALGLVLRVPVHARGLLPEEWVELLRPVAIGATYVLAVGLGIYARRLARGEIDMAEAAIVAATSLVAMGLLAFEMVWVMVFRHWQDRHRRERHGRP